MLQGLAKLPQADSELRDALSADAAIHGWAHLHARLAQLDPPSAARLHPNDAQRIQRALEVCIVSGKAMSELLADTSTNALSAHTLKIVAAPASRATLHARIHTRFAAMLDAGLIDEVQALRLRPGVHAQLPSMRSVGYRQTWAYLDGELSREMLLERGVIATRQLARRQLTWLRAQQQAEWFDSTDMQQQRAIVARVEAWARP